MEKLLVLTAGLAILMVSVEGAGLVSRFTQDSCDFPPSLWCSSRRIADKCQVTRQCDQFVWLKKPRADDRVQFSLYLEALCPDCKYFISQQLWPTYQKISSIVDLDIIPYGNAEEEQDGDLWKFTCQHGPQECFGNILETCAMYVLKNISVSFPFIACIEMSDSPVNDSAKQCASKHGVDLAAVLDCAGGPLGNKLEHEMALKTDKLDPPHTSVPWVTLNGEHTDDIEQRAEDNLLQLLCDTYKGSQVPDACKQIRKP